MGTVYLGILVDRLPMTQGGSLRDCHGPVVVHTSEGSPSPVSFRWVPNSSALCFFVSSFEAVHCEVCRPSLYWLGTLFQFSTACLTSSLAAWCLSFIGPVALVGIITTVDTVLIKVYGHLFSHIVLEPLLIVDVPLPASREVTHGLVIGCPLYLRSNRPLKTKQSDLLCVYRQMG